MDISSTTGAVQTLSRSNVTVASGDSIGKIQFWNNDTQLTTQKIYGNIEVQAAQAITTDAAAGNMIFKTTGTTVAGSPIERMRIDSAGNVGVGTTTPASSLDIGAKTDGINMPRGTTAQQLACAAGTAGNMRYNSQTTFMEFCDGTAWYALPKVQPTTPPTVPSGGGYFVLSATTWDGFLPGRAGGDANCLTELTTTHTDWAGYADANGRGLLVAAKVKAFLCDTTNCTNLTPLGTYAFAVAGQPSAGGATFTADANGYGPNDSSVWSSANRFNGASTYWTGRGSAGTATTWGTAPGGSHCLGFTSNSGGQNGRVGDSSYSDSNRWFSGSVNTCSVPARLICIVNP